MVPHTLRHLFSLSFRRRYKDIVQLADVLYHSSAGTAGIYTLTSGVQQPGRPERVYLAVRQESRLISLEILRNSHHKKALFIGLKCKKRTEKLFLFS